MAAPPCSHAHISVSDAVTGDMINCVVCLPAAASPTHLADDRARGRVCNQQLHPETCVTCSVSTAIVSREHATLGGQGSRVLTIRSP